MGLILSLYRFSNVIRSYSEDFSTQQREPWPVFKCKWGLERVEGKAVKNFEVMLKIVM